MNNTNLALATPTTEPSSSSSHWHAYLKLTLALTARGVVLKHCEHKGPLYVQKPFYPEGRDLAHLYILHPPGGMVSGDKLEITSEQDPHSKVLITTPGAGRVYKARPDKSLQHQIITLNVADNASMEWLPQETILYPDAHTRLDTNVQLGENAKYIGWEVTSFGLPASQQKFDSGRVNQCFELRQQGRLKVKERLVLHDDNQSMMQQLAGMNQQAINGFMVAGPFVQEDEQVQNLMQTLKSHCEWINQAKDKTIAGASLTGDYIIIRYLGSYSEQAKNLFIKCWQDIRPILLQREACKPRIWAT